MMKYKTEGQTGKISDQALINQLSQNVFSAATRRMPIIIAFFYYIFRALIGVASYAGKILLRSNMGERTYGVLTIFFVYLLIFLTRGTILIMPDIKAEWDSLDKVNIAGEISQEDEVKGLKTLDKVFIMGIFLTNSQDNDVMASLGVWTIFRKAFMQGGIGTEARVFWYLIITLSAFQYISRYRRKRRKEYIHSYYRGDSVFFGWFLGKKIGGFTIQEGSVRMYIEPLFLLFVSYVLAFGVQLVFVPLILKMSAVCLCIEEVMVYSENKKMVLDIMDSRIDAEYIASIQAQYTQYSEAQSQTHERDDFLIQ